MNRNVLIVMAGGFLIAVLVAVVVQASLGGKKEEVVAEVEQTMVLVAAKPIKTGGDLTNENMKWQAWPKSGVFEGAIIRDGNDKKPEDSISGRVVRDIAVGEPVLKNALVPKEGTLLAAKLNDGMRAAAIKVKAHTMAGGFVSPGDRVDVILTYETTINLRGATDPEAETMIERNIDEIATETILQDVRVLAVDQAAKRNEEKTKVGKTVTLEVNQRGAEILALADKMGDLTLALRKLGDDTIITTPPPVMTDARLTRIYDEVYDELQQMQNKSGQTRKSVRVYNGGYVSTITSSP